MDSPRCRRWLFVAAPAIALSFACGAGGDGSSGSAGSGATAGTPSGGSGGGAGVATAGAGTSGGGTAGSGGATSMAGSAGGGGTGGAGTGGIAGNAGTAGSGGQCGGSAAKCVCPAGATYGNPLMGMGSVDTIGPPTMGLPNYFAFIEGPVWIASLGALFFSDNVTPERIWKLLPGTPPSVFLEMSGSNGLAIDANDKLIVADQAGHRIVRIDPATPSASTVIVPAGSFTPNDLVVRSDGNIYFTDPNSSGRGFYRVAPGGTLSGPITAVNAPNGIVLSPDENTLYVGDVGMRTITKFTVAGDGSITEGTSPFATTMGDTLDGMAVDCAGNVYAGTRTGVEVYSPAGMPLGTVPTGESSNATFGGPDRKTLYVTSRSVLKSVTLAVPGLPD